MILPLDFGILGFHGILKIEGKKLEPPGSKCAPLSDPSNSVCAPVVRWASRGGQYDPHANDWFEDMQDAWIGVILLSPAFHFHDLPFFTVLFHLFHDLCIFFDVHHFPCLFFLGHPWVDSSQDISGVDFHHASLGDWQKLYFCAPPGGKQCGTPPCQCSNPPCDVCYNGNGGGASATKGCGADPDSISCKPPKKALDACRLLKMPRFFFLNIRGESLFGNLLDMALIRQKWGKVCPEKIQGLQRKGLGSNECARLWSLPRFCHWCPGCKRGDWLRYTNLLKTVIYTI